MLKRLCTAVAGLMVAVTFIAVAQLAANAQPSGTTLPFVTGIFDLVVDGAHDRVFVSGGQTQDGVAVLDYDGALLDTIPIAGASGMVQVGPELFVASAGDDDIQVVDLTLPTPAVSRTISIGTFTDPGDVAYVAGRLWFTIGTCGSFSMQHAAVATDGTKLTANAKSLGASYCPRYASGSTDPNALITFETQISSATMYAYDMSTAPPTLLHNLDNPGGAENLYQAAVAPDGGSIFLASGYPYTYPEIRRSDFATIRSYDADPYPTSVDVTSVGGGQLVGGSDSSYDTDVFVYDLGVTTAKWTYDFASGDVTIVPHGVAWAGDATRVFAVTSTSVYSGQPVSFYALDPLESPTTLTLSATPSTPTIGDSVSLDGVLTFGDGSSAAGQTVTFERKDDSGTTSIGQATTQSDGSFHIDDVPEVGGTVAYTASFAGIDHHPASSAKDTVKVKLLSVSVSATASTKTVTIGKSVTVKGHLGGGTKSRTLSIYAKPDGGSEKLLKKGTVDSHGNLSVKFAPTRDTTFIARYAGDGTHAAALDAVTTRVRVILTAKLTKYVSTSGAYRIYRAGTYAHCEVHVAPNHARFSVKATLQAYTGGAWKTLDTGSFPLNASSNTTFVIKGSANVNFRVMVQLPTHSDHIGDSSPWLYLRFT
ncbi:MAG: hypothetical protein ABJB55_00925 [Actinomycetota bacterium]